MGCVDCSIDPTYVSGLSKMCSSCVFFWYLFDSSARSVDVRRFAAQEAVHAAKEAAASATKDKKELLEKKRLIEARKERDATAAEIKALEAQGMNKAQARASALQRRAQQKMIKAKEATRDFMDKKDLGAKNILMDF